MNLTEDYCSFELSKLLKEKGFDGNCRQYDFEDWEKRHSTITSMRPYNFNEDDKCISIPTHQMAMKWLREKGYHIVIMKDVPKYQVYIQDLNDGGFNVSGITRTFNTYEEAIEAAIKYSLENLI